jgi:malate synthase
VRGPEIVARNSRMKANMEREGLPFNAERNMSYNSRLAQELHRRHADHGGHLRHFFGNDDVLYLMEDMATGEIRVSILWEWLHKGATLTEDDPSGVKAGDRFTKELFARLLDEEYGKLLGASNRDVHDNSKTTTLPIAREIVETYVAEEVKLPWYIDLLNVNIDNHDLVEAKRRIRLLADAFRKDGTRVTENLDFATKD